LAADVPVVVLPHGRDQGDNAVRVTLRGAGVALRRTASTDQVARAVRRVLDDPAYARRAAVLGAAVRHDAEHSTLVAELEAAEGCPGRRVARPGRRRAPRQAAAVASSSTTCPAIARRVTPSIVGGGAAPAPPGRAASTP